MENAPEVENAPEGVGTQGGQFRPQGPLERRQRPGGGSVLLPVRGAADTGQDALTLRYSMQRRWPPAVAGDDGGDALGVEAGHQSGDGVAGLAPRRLRRLREGVPVGHSQQSLSAGDLSGGPGLGAGDLFKLRALLQGQRAELLLLFSRHGSLQGVGMAQSTRS